MIYKKSFPFDLHLRCVCLDESCYIDKREYSYIQAMAHILDLLEKGGYKQCYYATCKSYHLERHGSNNYSVPGRINIYLQQLVSLLSLDSYFSLHEENVHFGSTLKV